MTIEVDGTRINCTDRRKFLADELEAWAWNNKATLFAEPKSRELTSGRLGFRESKPTVDEIEATGEEKKSTWALLRDKLKTVLLKTLERARMGAGRAAGPVFNIAITPNKPALLQAFKSKKLTAKQLARLGFKHRPATDAFFLELEAKEITAPAAAEPPAAA